MQQDANVSDRSLWIALIMIVAVLVAAGTAVVLHLAGASPASVVTTTHHLECEHQRLYPGARQGQYTLGA